MKKNWLSRIVPLIVFAVIIVSAYFINVEVQSRWGKQALEKTGLVSYPLEQALDKARQEKKRVLVDVSAIWCSTCRKLDNEIFANDEVKSKLNESYIFARLEYESDEGQKFLETHKASGFPTLWVLDEKGNVIKRLRVTFDKHEFLWQLNQ